MRFGDLAVLLAVSATAVMTMNLVVVVMMMVVVLTIDSDSVIGNSLVPTSINDDPLQKFLNRDYKWGFNQDIDSFTIPEGLSEETIRLISLRKNEPDWMLEFRLNSYKKFWQMSEPKWSDNDYPVIKFEDLCFYSEPKKKPTLNSLDEADPELIKYFEKLGIPFNERNRLTNVAVDAVLDSVSIATTHRKTLEKSGLIFCSISEAIKEYPDLIKKYLGTVVSSDDNFYAALNSAVFSDGSFVYIPKDTKCPMQISTYFRINAMEMGQFERTLIVAEDRSFVEYLEGCTAPSYDTNQLHAVVVELYCHEGAEIKYSTAKLVYSHSAVALIISNFSKTVFLFPFPSFATCKCPRKTNTIAPKPLQVATKRRALKPLGTVAVLLRVWLHSGTCSMEIQGYSGVNFPFNDKEWLRLIFNL